MKIMFTGIEKSSKVAEFREVVFLIDTSDVC